MGQVCRLWGRYHHACTVSCIMLSKPLNLSDLDLRGPCPGPHTWQTSKWFFLLPISKEVLFLFGNRLSQWEGLLSWIWPPGQRVLIWEPWRRWIQPLPLPRTKWVSRYTRLPRNAAPSLPPPRSEDVDLEALRTLWKALVKQGWPIGGEPAKPTSLGSWAGHSHFGLGTQRSGAWASSHPAPLQHTQETTGLALERVRLLQPPGTGCSPRRAGRQNWLTQPSSSFRYLVCGSPLALALAQKW